MLLESIVRQVLAGNGLGLFENEKSLSCYTSWFKKIVLSNNEALSLDALFAFFWGLAQLKSINVSADEYSLPLPGKDRTLYDYGYSLTYSSRVAALFASCVKTEQGQAFLKKNNGLVRQSVGLTDMDWAGQMSKLGQPGYFSYKSIDAAHRKFFSSSSPDVIAPDISLRYLTRNFFKTFHYEKDEFDLLKEKASTYFQEKRILQLYGEWPKGMFTISNKDDAAERMEADICGCWIHYDRNLNPLFMNVLFVANTYLGDMVIQENSCHVAKFIIQDGRALYVNSEDAFTSDEEVYHHSLNVDIALQLAENFEFLLFLNAALLGSVAQEVMFDEEREKTIQNWSGSFLPHTTIHPKVAQVKTGSFKKIKDELDRTSRTKWLTVTKVDKYYLSFETSPEASSKSSKQSANSVQKEQYVRPHLRIYHVKDPETGLLVPEYRPVRAHVRNKGAMQAVNFKKL